MPVPVPPVTVTAVTLAGGPGLDADHVLITGRAAAVLDGGWYARALGRALTGRLDDVGRPLAEIVREAIREVCDRFELGSDAGPTSTVTISRWDEDTVDLYVLGDSPAVVYPREAAAILVADDRLAGTAPEERAACVAHLRAGHGYDARLTELVADLRRAERAHRNREGGYWVAGGDPAAAEHAIGASFARAEVAAVLLLSDGAAVDVTGYGRHDWDDVHELVTAEPGSYLRDVHAAEDADHDGRWWPRPRRHDDKSLISVVFAPWRFRA